MKELIVIFIVIFMLCCKSNKLVDTEHCKSYYDFLQENWIYDKDNSCYSFKGNPRYWNAEIYKNYVDDDCLIGLSKKAIVQIFGKPTKYYESTQFNTVVYCLDDLCLKQGFIYGGKLLRFNFNKNDIVIEVFTAPGDNNIPDD